MEKKMYILSILHDPAVGTMPFPLVAEEGEDTPICPTCKGSKTVNGQLCSACHGTGYSDRQTLYLEEEDPTDYGPDDLDGMAKEDEDKIVSDEVSQPCPHCGKDLKVTVTVH